MQTWTTRDASLGPFAAVFAWEFCKAHRAQESVLAWIDEGHFIGTMGQSCQIVGILLFTALESVAKMTWHQATEPGLG
jgi:hypothetical protein